MTTSKDENGERDLPSSTSECGESLLPVGETSGERACGGVPEVCRWASKAAVFSMSIGLTVDLHGVHGVLGTELTPPVSLVRSPVLEDKMSVIRNDGRAAGRVSNLSFCALFEYLLLFL